MAKSSSKIPVTPENSQVASTEVPFEVLAGTLIETPTESVVGTAPAEPAFSYDVELAKLIETRRALTYPVAKVMCKQTEKEGEWDAEFTGQAVGRLLDCKFAKSNSGSPQIWLRGIIVRDYPADFKGNPEAEKDNPEGYCYSLRPGDDFQGMEGYRSVVGFPFVTTVTLTKAAVGKDVGAVEVSVNTLSAFGYRGLGPLDFVPVKGEPSVLAKNLPLPEHRGDGATMDSEVLLEFVYKPADGNFPARVQLKKVSVLEYRANVDEVAMLQDDLLDFFAASLKGRVDTRKVAVDGTAERMGLRKPRAVAGGVSAAAGLAGAVGAVGAAASTASTEQPAGPQEGKCGMKIHGGKFCNRLPGHDKPGKDEQGKPVAATQCSTIPF